MVKAESVHNFTQETLVGVVIPDMWDEDYEVISVYLSCQGEKEVSILNLDQFPALLRMVQMEIVVTGLVDKQSEGEAVIIESISILKSTDF